MVGVEPELVAWMREQVANEVARVKEEHGQAVLPLKVKNFAIIRKSSTKVVNRIEFDTAWDFDNVTQILVSEPIDVPPALKPKAKYIQLVLLCDKPLPLLAPYIYSTSHKNNDLHHWLFINNKLKHSMHEVEAYV